MDKKIVGVIPARYNSSRMPGKPLMDILGKPMIWWVYQQAIKCKKLDEIVVATDDNRIEEICLKYHMNVVMTSEDNDTPTDRLCEVSKTIQADLYLLIMGDEPLVDVNSLTMIIPTTEVTDEYVAVLSNVIDNPSEVIDFSNQKVVTNSKRDILFISRSPIPYPKGTLDIEYEKVTGVQLFSKKALEFYGRTNKSGLEKAEENDLMRFIENGINVKLIKSPYNTVSVDTPKDLEYVCCFLKDKGADESNK